MTVTLTSNRPSLIANFPACGYLRRAYWAGKESVVMRTGLRRTLSRYTRIVPVADDTTALAPAVKILEQGDTLIWFPEGARSNQGSAEY